MSTPNFAYEHRCIVITDDDLEFGNLPETEPIAQGFTCYPLSLIPTSFNFYNVVLTSGYYEAACIDYEEKDGDYKELLGFSWYYEPESKKEVFEDLIDLGFKISRYMFNKLCKDIKRANFKYDYDYFYKIFEAVGEYLMEIEEVEVNKYLDKLMADYGYDEYVCTARFSNGEAWYEKKATSGREALLQAVAS